mgnify:FL=1
MNRDKLTELYKKYNLSSEDFFKHQHYTIITRSGIERIIAAENIEIKYEVIKCETNFAVVKATAKRAFIKDTETIETFGSALKGASYNDGSTNTWYIMEMAEKRAMSRACLKLCGLYSMGVFGEDESESFKRK